LKQEIVLLSCITHTEVKNIFTNKHNIFLTSVTNQLLFGVLTQWFWNRSCDL